jgi:hypothetical protein
VSLPFSSAGNSQSILFGTVILEIMDVNVSENTTRAGAVIDVVTTVNASWDVFDFSAFHVETYYDSQLIDYHVFFVLGMGQDIINFTSVWNTTGVEPGSYTISAIAYGSNLDNFIDGFVQILPPPKTWIVDDDGPADFSTIQEAINATSDGDTVFVKNGTYNVVDPIHIDKSLTLVGENKYGTIMDGNSVDLSGIEIMANDVRISNFTIQNASRVIVDGYVNITFFDNIMLDNFQGIRLINTSGDLISNNIINGNSAGSIGFDWVNDTIVRNNTITNSGYLGAIDSGYPNYNNTFSENNIIGNSHGIYVNNVFNDNKFFHNNFINNTIQVFFSGPVKLSSWDNGYPSGGNFWSDCNGSDLYLGPAQDQIDSDGIGDTPYLIDENNTDHYPLMSSWTPPDAAALNISSSKTIVGEGFSSNVTVFLENQGNKIEEFNATFYANETFIGYQTFILRSNNSIIYSSERDFGSLAKGNYSLSVRIEPLEGEADLNDNSLSGSWVFITIPGDLNGDNTVDIYDAILLVGCFNSFPYSPHWNPDRDINNDGIIDIYDALILAANYGKSWT